jgi:Xaa-Pro aminopeptidase
MNDRHSRISSELSSAGLKGLVCALPENILFLTGYWPSTNESILVRPTEGLPTLIVPSVDGTFIPQGYRGEVAEYHIEPDDIKFGRTRQKLLALVKDVLLQSGLGHGRIGCERSFEVIAGSFRGSEAGYPGFPFFEAVITQLPDVELVDQAQLLIRERQVKSTEEIERLRIAHEIAAQAFMRGREAAVSGSSETHIATVIEGTFSEFGVGYKGVSRARGYAFVMSGPEHSADAWLSANFSTIRRVREGDLVLVEFNGFADGFWVDLSRTFVVGSPNSRQGEIHKAVKGALREALKAVRASASAGVIDSAARSSFEGAGLANYFPHYIGHGTGFAFHENPILSPGSAASLAEDMVLAIEPGLYVSGFGGIRIEENVVVRKDAEPLMLSDFDNEL